MQHQPTQSLHHPPAAGAPAAEGSSRRFFLTGTSVVALAATAGGTAVWGHGSPGSSTGADGTTDEQVQAGTVVAYIRPGESEVTVMSGDRQVVVDDPALARAIARTLGAR